MSLWQRIVLIVILLAVIFLFKSLPCNAQKANGDGGQEQPSLSTEKWRLISPRWEPKQLHGRSFRYILPHSYIFGRKAGMTAMDEPFIKDAVLQTDISLLLDADFRKRLRKFSNPVMFGRVYSLWNWWFRTAKSDAERQLFDQHYKKMCREFGDRFIGLGGTGEGMGWCGAGHNGCVIKIIEAYYGKKIHDICVAPPSNPAEVRDWMLKLYTAWTCGNATDYKICGVQAAWVDHFLYEHGLYISTPEVGCGGGPIPCTPMQLASVRGAARQYAKPWGAYVASYLGGDMTDYRGLFPWVRGYKDRGPLSGPSISLMKRIYYAAYMSGANVIEKEEGSDRQGTYIGGYDPTVKYAAATQWLVAVLKEKHFYLSPLGRMAKEMYENIVIRHDRGITYTPIALLVNSAHGSTMYNLDLYWAAGTTGLNRKSGMEFKKIPLNELQYMFRATINTLFPWEHSRGESRTLVSGPFGDVFDVISTEASLATMNAYKLIVLIGDTDVNAACAGKLKQFVKQGGVVMANTRQLNDNLPTRWFGCSQKKETRKAKAWRWQGENQGNLERNEFEYDVVTLDEGRPLAQTDDGDQGTLVAEKKHEAGQWILTTPLYLRQMATKNKMLTLFSEMISRYHKQLLPVSVAGKVEYIVNRNKRGWVITLINNEGVIKMPGKAEIVDTNMTAHVKVVLKKGELKRVKCVKEWVTGQTLEFFKNDTGTDVALTVPPGDVRIIEFDN